MERASVDDVAAVVNRPKIQSPTLVIHGLADTSVTADTLSGTWGWTVGGVRRSPVMIPRDS